jgi:hypothetical protein
MAFDPVALSDDQWHLRSSTLGSLVIQRPPAEGTKERGSLHNVLHALHRADDEIAKFAGDKDLSPEGRQRRIANTLDPVLAVAKDERRVTDAARETSAAAIERLQTVPPLEHPSLAFVDVEFRGRYMMMTPAERAEEDRLMLAGENDAGLHALLRDPVRSKIASYHREAWLELVEKRNPAAYAQQRANEENNARANAAYRIVEDFVSRKIRGE